MKALPHLPQFADDQEEESMIYPFRCYDCELDNQIDARPFRPPNAPRCPSCGQLMDRVFGCQINTESCKDHDFIPDESRVVESDRSYDKSLGVKKEQAYRRARDRRRAQLADGGNKGSFKHTHSVPAELYHGKIKQTGDPDYWKDPKNLKRHKSTEVS